MALIITEIGLFKRYIANNWPLLGINSGFVTLGVLMLIVGVSTLGNLNKTATSEKSLGSQYWSLVIAAGILICIMGIVNMFANYMFRQKSMDITARQVRAHGSTAPQKVDAYLTPSMSTRSTPKTRKSFGLNRRTMSETLPSYHTPAPPAAHARNISNPLPTATSNKYEPQPPVVNGIQRPDLTAHPAYQGGAF